MINKGSVRRKSVEIFRKVIELRKKEYSYAEIRKETGVAKSTINNWLTLAGLTLTKEHLQIQAKKREENHIVATEASKRTRARRKEADIQNFIMKNKTHFNDPFFNYGVALFEAEGSKETRCIFSNSDFRIIEIFVMFIEKYFLLKRDRNMVFRLYIHESRRTDLEKIKRFWSKKINIPVGQIRLSWKRNKIVKRRENPDYVGQVSVSVGGERMLGSKLLAISDIILRRYQRVY